MQTAQTHQSIWKGTSTFKLNFQQLLYNYASEQIADIHPMLYDVLASHTRK